MSDDREAARRAFLRIGEMCGVDYDDNAPLDFLARQAEDLVAELQKSRESYRRLYRELSGQSSGRDRRTVRRWLKS